MSVVWDMVRGEMELPEAGEATAERGLPEHGFEMPRLMERIEERQPKGSRVPLPAVIPAWREDNKKKGRIVRH